MSDAIRVAVLGCGYWGRNLVRNFHSLGVLGLVCDPSEAGRRTAQEVAPGTPVSADFQQAFAHPEIHAIAIATPAETHASLAIAAMEAGKAVFIEKPLALNSVDGARIRDTALRLGRIAMVGHLLEYHPAVVALRAALAAGELGRLLAIYSSRLNFGKVRTAENALWSLAPHDVSVILRLTGALPSEVVCVGAGFLQPGIADAATALLSFADGLRAQISASWIHPFKEQKLVVVGDRRMAVFDDTTPDKLVIHDRWVEFRDGMPLLRQDGPGRPVFLTPQEPLQLECRHFLDCIREGKTPLTDADSGLNVVKVLQACQTSLESNGRPVALGGN